MDLSKYALLFNPVISADLRKAGIELKGSGLWQKRDQ